MIVIIRDRKTGNIIDTAVPGDAGIVENEKEKVEKYKDLELEIQRMWHMKTIV